MNLPNKALQIAYFQALDGSITYNGSVVPVFDIIPHNQEYPYIVLGSQTTTEEVSKDDFGFEVFFQLDVVTGFESSFGGKSQAYDITDAVVDTIRTRADQYLSLSSGFGLYGITLDSSVITQERSDTHNIITNNIRIRNLIQKVS